MHSSTIGGIQAIFSYMQYNANIIFSMSVETFLQKIETMIVLKTEG